MGKIWERVFRRSVMIFFTIGIFIALFSKLLDNPLIFASFASSVFILIARPNTYDAHPRVVVGSHLIAAFVGFGITFLPIGDIPFFAFQVSPIKAGLAVGLAGCLMIILNVKHAPAASTALSFAFQFTGLSSFSLFLRALLMILALGLIKGAWHLADHLFGEVEEEVEDVEAWFIGHKHK